MLKRINVVFNYATDLKAAEKFYVDNFGFLVVSRDENWVEFELPGANYALHKARADRVPGKDYSHLCFEVDDVEQTCKTLAGKGVCHHCRSGWQSYYDLSEDTLDLVNVLK